MTLHHAALLHSLEAVPSSAWTAREDGVVDWISSEAARYLGITGVPDEDAWPRVVHPGDFARAQEAWRQALASGGHYRANVRLLSALSGRYRWHLCQAHRLLDDDGTGRWVGLNVDIDESYREIEVQHASIERLQAERERLRSVFANCPVAITVYQGSDHRITLQNEAHRRIVGGRNLEGRVLAEAFPEIVSQGLITLLDSVLATGETFEATEFEVTFDARGDGSLEVGYFNFTLQVLLDAEGRRQGVLSSAVDVTEQVLARRRIGQLAAEREAVLAQFSEGIILTDADGRITFVNPLARELHGVARLDIGPDGYADSYALLREDGSPYPTLELPLARAVLRGETVENARWRIRRPDGTEVLVEGGARPVLDPHGARLGAVLMLHPLVERATVVG